MHIQKGLLLTKFCLVLAISVVGCRKEEPECIPSGKVNVVEVEKTPIPNSELNRARENMDQCHACVLSKQGFYSCQTVFQTRKETRVELKAKARKKACLDAGYGKDSCPDSAVKLVQCKGDEPPKDSELAKSFRRMIVRAAQQGNASTQSSSTSSKPNAKETPAAESSDDAGVQNKQDAASTPGGSQKFQPEVE